MSACAYIVAYVPPGCTELSDGDIVYTECPEWGTCGDIIIDDPGSPCDGAQLVALDCSCIEP